MPSKSTKKIRAKKKELTARSSRSPATAAQRRRTGRSRGSSERDGTGGIASLARTRAALRQSDERFRIFLDHAPNLAFVKGTDGRYLYANRKFEEVFQLSSANLLGRTDVELFSREQAAQFQAHDRQVLHSGQAAEFEETAEHADGLRTSIVVKFPLREVSGRIYAIGGIATDITDRKRVEEELQRSQEELRRRRTQLQSLTSKLIAAQERERQRIARELHDDVSQRLAALVLDVVVLEQQPPLMPEFVATALEPIRNQLEQLADDIHNLAYKLHPSLLEHAGLQPAIEDHIHQVTQRTGLRITVKAGNIPGWLSLDQATGLFRVLQESLQNIVKHAQATDVTVKLSGSSSGIGLFVIDNGRGFDASDKSDHQKGLGLISMQERMRLLNGLLRIHSRPADGTKVCAWIPSREQGS